MPAPTYNNVIVSDGGGGGLNKATTEQNNKRTTLKPAGQSAKPASGIDPRYAEIQRIMAERQRQEALAQQARIAYAQQQQAALDAYYAQMQQQRQNQEFYNNMLNNEALQSQQSKQAPQGIMQIAPEGFEPSGNWVRDAYNWLVKDIRGAMPGLFGDKEMDLEDPYGPFAGPPDGQTFGEALGGYMYPTVAAAAQPDFSLNDYFSPQPPARPTTARPEEFRSGGETVLPDYYMPVPWFYRNDKTNLPDYQWERDQSVMLDDVPAGEIYPEPTGGGGGGGYDYTPATYNYPRYTTPEQISRWYENMLQWRID